MKIIDLDKVENPDIFLLGSSAYKYLKSENDKNFYLENILKLDPKKDNSAELKKIFKSILENQNIFVDITNEDIFWLFQYFNSKYL